MPELHNIVCPWGGWSPVKLLGLGTYGEVNLFRREEYGSTYYCAIKHISIPTYQDKIDSIYTEGAETGNAAMQAYCDQLLESFEREINVNLALKGHTNFVAYDDYRIFPRADEPGYDIYIKMEHLTTLSEHLQQQSFSLADVLRLGEDICTAISVLEEKGLVYRHIKLENIFVNKAGDFKLGDFKIVSYAEGSAAKAPVHGALDFPAPELIGSEDGDSRADIYSLGLVLYRLLNGYRAPFLPPLPIPVTQAGSNAANEMRMNGARLSSPVYADKKLSDIILKACAFEADKRWADARQMKEKIIQYSHSLSDEEKQAIVLDIAVKAKETTSPKGSNANNSSVSVSTGADIGISTGINIVTDKSVGTGNNFAMSAVKQVFYENKRNYDTKPKRPLRFEKNGRTNAQRSVPIVVVSCIVVFFAIFFIPYFQNGSLWNNPMDPQNSMKGAVTANDSALDETVPDEKAPVPVDFHDAVIESAIRQQLHKEAGPIYPEDLSSITELRIETGTVKLIIDLFDLPELKVLGLRNQPLFDHSMLSQLKGLEVLNVSRCSLDDASPIENLTHLTKLDISDNYLTDINFVSSLKNITYLNINHNDVSDLSPLVGLAELNRFEAERNPVQDWSFVEDVPVVRGRPEQTELVPPPAYEPKVIDLAPAQRIASSDVQAAIPVQEPVEQAAIPAQEPVEQTPPANEPAAPLFVAVSYITGVPSTATVGTPLALSGTVSPANATNKDIIWSIMNAGETGATVKGNALTAKAAGTVILSATIKNGRSEDENFTKIFKITVN